MLNPNNLILLSISGSLFAVLGSFISALAYTGKGGEPYSPLNHFISELGDVGVSRHAWVFNLGLILSGLCLIPGCIALGLLIPGFLSKVGMAAGVVTALGLSLVGLFPMNKLKPHTIAAMTFFYGGLLMVLTFSIAIALQPASSLILPRVFSLAGLPAILSFVTFLFLISNASMDTENPLAPMEGKRPKIWMMPILEWLIFLTIVAWFLLIAIGLSN